MNNKFNKFIIRLMSLLIIIVLSLPQISLSSGDDIRYNGNDEGDDIMLQAFHWESHQGGGGKSWYQFIEGQADNIGEYFTAVWMPPPSDCVSDEGYQPTRWYNLDKSKYGSQQQLKEAIKALHDANVKVLADIVINHRSADDKCDGKWADFNDPKMTGKENFLINQVPHDCGNGYPTAEEGTWSFGNRIYFNEDWDGTSVPDLNHWSAHTRKEVRIWLNWLRNGDNAGFDGFRYDMTKGYDPAFLGEYNYASDPYISIAEHRDQDRQQLADVINRSGDQTMVFDFALKNKMNGAFHDRGNMYGSALGEFLGENGSRGFIGWWSNAAVTFVENHDTGGFSRWGENSLPTPCDGDLISVKCAYALILSHPGIPCVYWFDWRDRSDDMKYVIEELIRIRKSNNVKRYSRIWVDKAEDGLYTALIGDNSAEQVAVKIGMQGWDNYEKWLPPAHLNLNHAFERHVDGCHAFTIYYKNRTW